MKHIFVINPHAGNGSEIHKIKNKIETVAYKKGIDFDFVIESEKEEAKREILKFLNEETDIRFYACGGDGTLSFVSNCIFGYKNAQLSMIPCGTGNDFPKSFQNNELFSDIESQIDGSPIEIDAIMCNGIIALNLLNIGFDAEVVKETDKIKSIPLYKGHMSYIVGVIKCLLRMPTVQLEITLPDGNIINEELLLFVTANASFYGGGFKAAADAVINDGLADILIVRKVSRLKFIKLVSKYKNGCITEVNDFKNIGRFIRCSEIKLKSKNEFLLCCDGELELSKSAEISIIKRAIRLSLPVGCTPINGLCQLSEDYNPYNEPSPVHKS